jgi:hypothetical protein
MADSSTSPARTLVAAIAGANIHTLYFSDGIVVGYDPELARVTRVHQLPADFGAAEPVAARHRATPVIPLLAALTPADRRHEDGPTPPDGGRRAEDTGMRLP